jgi:hypothetical protein
MPRRQVVQAARKLAREYAIKAFVARKVGDAAYLANDKAAMKAAYEVAKEMDRLCDAQCKIAAAG